MTKNPSEEAAARLFRALDKVFLPFTSEEEIIDKARDRLNEQHPGTPVTLALKYAIGNTRNITKGMEGLLAPLVKKAVLSNQLDRSDRYLVPLSKFFAVGDPGEVNTIDKKN